MLEKSSTDLKKLIGLGVILVSMVLSGCAKKLEEDVSDDIADNVHEVSMFSNKVIAETTGEEEKTVQSEISQVYAIAEKSLRPLRVIEGDSRLKVFFKNLKIESDREGQRFEISFKLTRNYMVAYAKNLESGVLSTHYTTYAHSPSEAAIFQYEVDGYGYKRRAKNSLGEETRTIEFVTTDKNSASHVRINSLASSRELGGLHGKDDNEKKEIFIKRRLERRNWTRSGLRRLFANQTILNASSHDGTEFSDTSLFKIRIYDNELNIYRPINKEGLNAVERFSLGLGYNIKNLRSCDATTLAATELTAENCILRSEFQAPISHVTLVPKVDVDGEELAEVEISNEVDEDQATLVKITARDVSETDDDLQRSVPFVEGEILTDKQADYDMEAEYLYVPSTHNTPRNVVEAAPFFQGDEKIVKLRMTEEGLKVFEVEKDERFRGTGLNDSPVLTIPGQHKDYKCAGGDTDTTCEQGIVEDNSKDWDQRRFFVPNFDRMSKQEVNTVDLFTVAESCFIETGSRMTHHELRPGVINVEIEKTFRVSPQSRCIVYLFYTDNLSSASFNVTYFYSLVRLDDLKSDDYVAINYPIQDHDDFGFFKSEETNLRDDFDAGRTEKQYWLNRFNPKKDKVVYKLSSSFGKPENRIFLEGTREVVDALNNSLRRAEAGFQIELEEPSEFHPGDLRHNSIVLIEDPLANGLLGYGPSVANPRTGEIVQAHTNMYGGVLRQTVRRTYDMMVDISEQQRDEARAAAAAAASSTPSTDDDTESTADETPATEGETASVGANSARIAELVRGLHHAAQLSNLDETADYLSSRTDRAHAIQERQLHAARNVSEEFLAWDAMHASGHSHRAEGELPFNREDIRNVDFLRSDNGYEKMLDRYSKNNALHMDVYLEGFLGKRVPESVLSIPGIKKEDGTLKHYDDLAEGVRQQMIDIVLKHAYVTTLAHEIGHNLGLRHNFAGSTDKDNYYNEEEMAARGLEHQPKYSSIMDYSFSELNSLTVLGKYDEAALRFGYARKVELKDGSFAQVPTTLLELKESTGAPELRDFGFCTDENAGLSATCNRFDEGATITEIARHYIDNYKSSYKYLNKRNGRMDFSTFGMGGYIWRQNSRFKRMRLIFEDFEMFGSIFDHEFMLQGCDPAQTIQYPICKQINDRRDAAKLVGEFLLEILKTPDHMCAIADAATPDTVKELKRFVELYEDVKYSIDKKILHSCFDQEIKDKLAEDNLVVVAEGGKSIVSYKGTDRRFPYKSDIDVRGVWADKLLAMRALTTRWGGMSSTEDGQRSYVEHPEIRSGLLNLLTHMVLGNPLENPVKFKKEDGSEIAVDYKLSLDSYIIPEQAHWYPIVAFGLPFRDSARLNEIILKTARKSNTTTDPAYRSMSENFVDAISVVRRDIADGINNDELATYETGQYVYAAGERHQTARLMIDSIDALEFLNGVEQSTIISVIRTRLNPPLPDGLTEDQRLAIGVPEDLLDVVVRLIDAGQVLTEEEIAAQVGPELAARIMAAFRLGKEGIEELREIKAGMGQAPADATDEVKKLYALDMNILQAFLLGNLEEMVETYRQRIDLLPVINQSIDVNLNF